MMESKKKKVKLGMEYFRDAKYEKLKEYVKVKYDYISQMGRLEHLGDRESYEMDIKWRMICDISEFIDEIELNDIRTKTYHRPRPVDS